MCIVLIVINIVFMIGEICVRYNHAGRVCSGDYLSKESDPNSNVNYLVLEGEFLKNSIIFSGSMILIGIILFVWSLVH